VRFLIDECLHTSLAEVAKGRGYEATHVNYRGLNGAQDWESMAPIRAGDFTFVTNNARDFRRLYAREEVHAGLIILIPQVPPVQQRRLFAAVLDDLDVQPGLVNEAIEIELVGGAAEVTRYPLP